jgi:hypothetical protein
VWFGFINMKAETERRWCDFGFRAGVAEGNGVRVTGCDKLESDVLLVVVSRILEASEARLV